MGAGTMSGLRTGVRFSLPYLVLAALFTVDLVLGPLEPLTGTYGAAALVAAVLSGPIATGVAATVSALAAVGASALADTAFGAATVRLLLVVAMGVSAVVLSWQRRKRMAELAEVRLIAEVAQRAVLAPVPPRVGNIRIAGAYVSAAQGASVGGDLYEVVPVGDTVRLIMGDVRGKGLDAVRLAAVVLGAFREAAVQEAELTDVAAGMDSRLGRFLSSEDFITAVLAQVDEAGMEVVSCGHPPPLMVREGQARLLEAPPALPLGLGTEPESVLIPLKPHDRLLFYTDGLIEARDRRRRFVRMERVTAGIEEASDPQEAIDGILTRLHGIIGPQLDDDLALLLLEYDGPVTG